MADFTLVSDEVLEPGKPIRSIDILAIRDNTLFLFDASIGFPILDQQRFDASGTWTKPNISNPEVATVLVLLVGGGGSGGVMNYVFFEGSGAGGGGTGAVLLARATLANTSSANITIGSGGAGVSTTGASQRFDGNSGGNSTFVMSEGNLTANGGGGGRFYDRAVVAPGGGAGSISATGVWLNQLNLGKGGRSYPLNPHAISAQPVFSGGGAAGQRSNGSIFTENYNGGPALNLISLNNEPFMGAGGTGSASTGTNGADWGAGGGAAAANSGTMTSGSGAAGGAFVFVVRGIIDTNGLNDKYLQIP